MSLMSLVAAMRPKSKGSSTMGMKKSVVETTPRVSSMAYTAASSREALPTQRRGSRCWAPLPARMVSNTLGEILQPQPAPWLYWVRRTGSLMTRGPAENENAILAGPARPSFLRRHPHGDDGTEHDITRRVEHVDLHRVFPGTR